MPRKKSASGSSAVLDSNIEIAAAPPHEASEDAAVEALENQGPSALVEEILPSHEQGSLNGSQLLPDDPIAEPTGAAVAEVIHANEDAPLPVQGEISAAIEAILFASPEPVSVKKIAECLDGVDAKTVREVLLQLQIQLDRDGRGVQILEVAGGYQMATRDRFADCIYRLGSKKKRQSLSNATLETLAIIAYRQPVIRAVVESIRGVESSGTVRNLLDLGLIEIVGYKEVIGRPPMYGTTEKFLRVFGLRNLTDLPSIRGLKERFADDEPLLVPTPKPGPVAEELPFRPEIVNGAGPEPSPESAEGTEEDGTAEVISTGPQDPLAEAAQGLAERMDADDGDDDDMDDDDADEEEFDDEDDEELDDEDDDLDDEDDEEFDDDEDEDEDEDDDADEDDLDADEDDDLDDEDDDEK